MLLSTSWRLRRTALSSAPRRWAQGGGTGRQPRGNSSEIWRESRWKVKLLGREASISVMSPGESTVWLSPCSINALPRSWKTVKVRAVAVGDFARRAVKPGLRHVDHAQTQRMGAKFLHRPAEARPQRFRAESAAGDVDFPQPLFEADVPERCQCSHDLSFKQQRCCAVEQKNTITIR